MKFVSFASFLLIVFLFVACGNKPAKPKSFCSDPCLKDTLKFTADHPSKPRVYISASSCSPDTILWSHAGLENNRKMGLSDLLGQPVTINKEFVRCEIFDTSYVWVQLNDCSTFRGYLLKLPFDKKKNISKYSGALTDFDPKFKIADGLVCYSDRAFIFVEDKVTGKIEKMKLADHSLDIDFNDIHAAFDSINVTRTRIFVTMFENKEVKKFEKTISL
ncbi:MAG: hypothetical protein QM764_19795 [Chitinophagaceae bacterium]